MKEKKETRKKEGFELQKVKKTPFSPKTQMEGFFVGSFLLLFPLQRMFQIRMEETC